MHSRQSHVILVPYVYVILTNNNNGYVIAIPHVGTTHQLVNYEYKPTVSTHKHMLFMSKPLTTLVVPAQDLNMDVVPFPDPKHGCRLIWSSETRTSSHCQTRNMHVVPFRNPKPGVSKYTKHVIYECIYKKTRPR